MKHAAILNCLLVLTTVLPAAAADTAAPSGKTAAAKAPQPIDPNSTKFTARQKELLQGMSKKRDLQKMESAEIAAVDKELAELHGKQRRELDALRYQLFAINVKYEDKGKPLTWRKEVIREKYYLLAHPEINPKDADKVRALRSAEEKELNVIQNQFTALRNQQVEESKSLSSGNEDAVTASGRAAALAKTRAVSEKYAGAAKLLQIQWVEIRQKYQTKRQELLNPKPTQK